MIFDNKIDMSLFYMSKLSGKNELSIYNIIKNMPDSIKENISKYLSCIKDSETVYFDYNLNNYIMYKYKIDHFDGVKKLTIDEYYKTNNDNSFFNFGFSIISYDYKDLLDLNEKVSLLIGDIRYNNNGKMYMSKYITNNLSEKTIVTKEIQTIGYKSLRKINKVLQKEKISSDIDIRDIYVRETYKY